MDPSGGAGDNAALKRTKATKPPSESDDNSGSATEVDHLSWLHNDILAKILSSIDSSPDAVRTCVLSRRWGPVWKLLPELRLRFPFFPELASLFAAALDDHQVPLRHLQVEGHGQGAQPESLATWLPAAARCVSGSFVLLNDEAPTPIIDDDERGEEEEAPAVTIELPCFQRATSISICLGFLCCLAMPPPDEAAVGGGVFSHLTDLCLEQVWLHHPSELGDVVSSARCPRLQTLELRRTPGLQVLTVRSTSLLRMKLEEVDSLVELTVEAPELKELAVEQCFFFSLMPSGPIAVAIAAPELQVLHWQDDMESQRLIRAQLSHLPRLRSLGCFHLFVYGTDDYFGVFNRDLLEVLQGIQFLENLSLSLIYAEDIENHQYLMEDMRTLPKVTTLHLIVTSFGHSIGASLFHILRVCSGIRKLVLEFYVAPGFEEPLTCPSGCICRQQSNWETEELVLVSLQEIEIQGFGRFDHDIGFVEQLFGWATSLRKAKILLDESVTEDVVKELCRMCQFFRMRKLHIDVQRM